MSIKPPPPKLPAEGWVTAKANPTETAASTALPPDCNMATPTSVACDSTVTTMPCRAWTGSRPASEVLAHKTSDKSPIHRRPRILIPNVVAAKKRKKGKEDGPRKPKLGSLIESRPPSKRRLGPKNLGTFCAFLRQSKPPVLH